MGEGTRRQSDKKTKGGFGGRKRACLAGKVWQRFWWEIWGVHTGIRAAPIFDWMQRWPHPRHLSVSRRASLSRHSSLVTSRFASVGHAHRSLLIASVTSVWDGHSWQPRVAFPFPAPCAQVRPAPGVIQIGRGGDLQAGAHPQYLGSLYVGAHGNCGQGRGAHRATVQP